MGLALSVFDPDIETASRLLPHLPNSARTITVHEPDLGHRLVRVRTVFENDDLFRGDNVDVWRIAHVAAVGVLGVEEPTDGVGHINGLGFENDRGWVFHSLLERSAGSD